MGLIDGTIGDFLLDKFNELKRKKIKDKYNRQTIEIIIKYLEYRNGDPDERDETIDKALLNVMKFYQ